MLESTIPGPPSFAEPRNSQVHYLDNLHVGSVSLSYPLGDTAWAVSTNRVNKLQLDLKGPFSTRIPPGWPRNVVWPRGTVATGPLDLEVY